MSDNVTTSVVSELGKTVYVRQCGHKSAVSELEEIV